MRPRVGFGIYYGVGPVLFVVLALVVIGVLWAGFWVCFWIFGWLFFVGYMRQEMQKGEERRRQQH